MDRIRMTKKNLRALAIMVITIGLFIGCGEESEIGNTQTVSQENNLSTREFKKESYQFRSLDKRDPFVVIRTSRRSKKVSYQRQSSYRPVRNSSLDISLEGFIASRDRSAALFYVNGRKWLVVGSKIINLDKGPPPNFKARALRDSLLIITRDGKQRILRLKGGRG